ncbi:hypothetical protein LTR28_000418, partial [Elasticomyces elasticus]
QGIRVNHFLTDLSAPFQPLAEQPIHKDRRAIIHPARASRAARANPAQSDPPDSTLTVSKQGQPKPAKITISSDTDSIVRTGDGNGNARL